MKKQYIVGIIVAVLIIVGGISYKVYADQQEEQRTILLEETQKNVLKNNEYKYLKDNKLINETQIKEYDNIIKSLENETLKMEEIKTYKSELNNIYGLTLKDIQAKHEKLAKEQKKKIDKIKAKTKAEKKEKKKLQKNVQDILGHESIATTSNYLKYLSTAIGGYKKGVSLNKDIEKLKKQVKKREAKKNVAPNNEQPNYNNDGYYDNGNYNNNNGGNSGGNSGGGNNSSGGNSGGNGGWDNDPNADWGNNPNDSGELEF